MVPRRRRLCEPVPPLRAAVGAAVACRDGSVGDGRDPLLARAGWAVVLVAATGSATASVIGPSAERSRRCVLSSQLRFGWTKVRQAQCRW